MDCLVALFRVNRAPPKKSGKMQRPESLQHYRRGGVGWEVWTGQEVTFIEYHLCRYFVGTLLGTLWAIYSLLFETLEGNSRYPDRMMKKDSER